jgi:hypothetical protein
MTSVPTALFAPTTHASFFRVVGAWRYLTTGTHPGGVAWAAGGAVARGAPLRPPLSLLPPHLNTLPSLPPLSLAGCGGFGVGWRRAAAAGAGVPCGVRVCRGRALPALSWVGAASATSPAAPFASSRGGPRVQTAARVFPLQLHVWLRRVVDGRVCGAGCAGRAQSQTAGSTPCPAAPWVLLMASLVGLSWSPSPTSPLSSGPRCTRPIKGWSGCQVCIACGMPRS